MKDSKPPNADPSRIFSEILTINEVADCLRISRRSVYRLTRAGDLPGKKVAGRWRFLLQDVLAWIRDSNPADFPKSMKK